MIFKDRVALYQPDETFEYGEYVRDNWTYQGTIACHIKFEANEQFVANRKQDIAKVIMRYEWAEFVLSFRDIVEYEGVYYRLLHDPVPTTGMNRTFYTVNLIEDPNVAV
jgi:hypothetical protein